MTAASPLLPSGLSVSGFPGGAGQNGLVFNGTNPQLGQNVNVNPGIVGFQGLGNLGVGRISPTSGIGGFVFSAASDTFNLLIRALRTQERLEVLKDPHTPLPDETVDIDRTITLGGTTLELSYVGANHSDSTLVMRLPREKIVFIVDTIPRTATGKIQRRAVAETFIPQ